MKPITPAEVVDKKLRLLPDEVLDACNELIAKYWNGRYSEFLQKEFIETIHSKREAAGKTAISNKEICDNKFLDIEDIYRAEGWKVEYDKPGYNETYEATFKFSK